MELHGTAWLTELVLNSSVCIPFLVVPLCLGIQQKTMCLAAITVFGVSSAPKCGKIRLDVLDALDVVCDAIYRGNGDIYSHFSNLWHCNFVCVVAICSWCFWPWHNVAWISRHEHRVQSVHWWLVQRSWGKRNWKSVRLLRSTEKCLGSKKPTGVCIRGIWRSKRCGRCCPSSWWNVSEKFPPLTAYSKTVVYIGWP